MTAPPWTSCTPATTSRPAELAGPVGHIAVFGANIGLLAAGLAGRYPHARLLAAEPGRDNAALARRNLAHLGVRCTLAEAALWYRDERLTLSWQPDAWGQALAGQPHHNGNGATTIRLDAIDAGKLLGGFSGQAPVELPAGQHRIGLVRDAQTRRVDSERPLHQDRDPGPLRRGGATARGAGLPGPAGVAELGRLRRRDPTPNRRQACARAPGPERQSPMCFACPGPVIRPGCGLGWCSCSGSTPWNDRLADSE